MSSPQAITLHFHPDWPHGDGLVIEAMAARGAYVNQFVSGVSNGLLAPHEGSPRWRWEERILPGRYAGRPPGERPVYGGWNDRGDRYGASPRFGSAHLRLRPDCVVRATFCFPDSYREPDDFGGPEEVSRLVALRRAAAGRHIDPLDDYVEAQVHGPVRFGADVEAVVLDPSHADGPVLDAAQRLGCPIEFHEGYRVPTDELPEDYRGAEPRDLARSLGSHLTPDVVAAARRTGAHDPQTVKQVWHLLARFGRVWGR